MYYEKSKLFIEKFKLSVINQNRNLYSLPKIVKEMQLKQNCIFYVCECLVLMHTKGGHQISLETAVSHIMWLQVIEPRTSGRRAIALNLSSHLSSP